MNWAGVSMIDLIKFVNPKPEWKYLIQYGADDYTTNVRDSMTLTIYFSSWI
jgi:DMSO/TMAO reductase YedYZ molybdopterin-dependent catalytic subunit